MSAMRTGSALATASNSLPKPKMHGFLRIARHGAGPTAMYVITYHRLDRVEGSRARPVAAESAQALIELLERIGVDFRSGEVRGALEDILRFGSAHIPDLWLTDEEMIEKGLVEG
jgi:hypothetical protein